MRFALALLALVAFAPAPAFAAHWTVDRGKSHLGFTVKWSDEPFVATFKRWTADIDFDPANLAQSHIVATIDLASESSDTPDNDEGVKGPEGFAVAQFPSARFECTSFAYRGGDSYLASGTLTLHGVTKPVALPFTLSINGNSAHVAGKTVVSRMDFGLGSGEWAAPEPIDHAIIIDVELVAKKAS